MGNLKKDGLALPLGTKMAPGGRDRGVVYVTVFDWLSWFRCRWTACDHHRLLLQWRQMPIWPLTWLVQLWKVPRKTPLLAYINQEFVGIKRNCLDGTPVASDCLFGTPRLCWGKFHCLSLSKAASLRPPSPQHHCSSYLRNSNSTQMILIHQLNFKRDLGKHSCCQKYLALFGLFHPNSSLCLD